jgi:hypothetical protein
MLCVSCRDIEQRVTHIWAGCTGELVGMQGAEITATPFHQIVGKKKAIKPELFHLAQSLAK